jgi:TPR repeat protein
MKPARGRRTRFVAGHAFSSRASTDAHGTTAEANEAAPHRISRISTRTTTTLIRSMLYVALVNASASSWALPMPSTHPDIATPASRRVDAPLSASIPFADPTGACPLMLAHWNFSPFETPASLRERCGKESERGNLDASVIYGQMLLLGYGGRPDAARGIATLEQAARDGSPPAGRTLGNFYHSGIGVPRDLATARMWFESAARGGDGISADILGVMSATGDGQPVDDAAAYSYFVAAADAGTANGATNAAKLTIAGRGVARDPARAAAWVIQGASGGDPEGEFILGLALMHGDLLPLDVANGAAWLTAAARAGQVDAKAALGDAYLSGSGVPRDEHRGFSMIANAAAQGSVYAQRRLGDLYASGTGVARDDVKARALYQKAALAGDIPARFALSNFYRTGRGGEVDLEAAISWMRSAADAGLAAAQNDLGAMLRDGIGTKRDPIEAKTWFEKADAQGLAIASLNLATCAYRGEGEPVDHRKAFLLASRGAERGNVAAAMVAAAMAWQGDGVPSDKSVAMRWYRYAADHGNVEAARWVGVQYSVGVAVPRDASLGLAYLKQAAQAGDPTSSAILGAYLANQHASWNGMTGIQWLQHAAERKLPAAYSTLGYLYLRGQGVERDPRAALEMFSRGAQLGDPTSQAWLCAAYFPGDGAMANPLLAARWCEAAAGNGNVGAMQVIALDARHEVSGASDRAYWLWKLADRGDAKYQSMLGDAYDLGDGVPADFAAATYWFRRAAEHGDASAQSSLAWHLLTGLGGRADAYEAFDWAMRAASTNADAQRMVGMAYMSGRGIARDTAAGRQWLSKAAADGSDWAESDLAAIYETGAGVSRDDATALYWHRRAAEHGSEASEIALALRAVAAGTEAALPPRRARWLVPADGSPLWGRDAAAADADTARSRWDALSCLNEAMLGNPLMQYDVGMRFLTGNGVPRDRALGAAWIARAKRSFEAGDGLNAYGAAITVIEERVAQRLSDDEKRRAAQIAAGFNASKPQS